MAVAEKGFSGEMWDDLNLDIIAGIDGRHWPIGGRHCWRFGGTLRSAVIWTGPGCWTWLCCPGDRGDVIDAVPILSLFLARQTRSRPQCVSAAGVKVDWTPHLQPPTFQRC